jgi:hypothetical protein
MRGVSKLAVAPTYLLFLAAGFFADLMTFFVPQPPLPPQAMTGSFRKTSEATRLDMSSHYADVR